MFPAAMHKSGATREVRLPVSGNVLLKLRVNRNASRCYETQRPTLGCRTISSRLRCSTTPSRLMCSTISPKLGCRTISSKLVTCNAWHLWPHVHSYHMLTVTYNVAEEVHRQRLSFSPVHVVIPGHYKARLLSCLLIVPPKRQPPIQAHASTDEGKSNGYYKQILVCNKGASSWRVVEKKPEMSGCAHLPTTRAKFFGRSKAPDCL
jgi:hypothetical protein